MVFLKAYLDGKAIFKSSLGSSKWTSVLTARTTERMLNRNVLRWSRKNSNDAKTTWQWRATLPSNDYDNLWTYWVMWKAVVCATRAALWRTSVKRRDQLRPRCRCTRHTNIGCMLVAPERIWKWGDRSGAKVGRHRSGAKRRKKLVVSLHFWL